MKYQLKMCDHIDSHEIFPLPRYHHTDAEYDALSRSMQARFRKWYYASGVPDDAWGPGPHEIDCSWSVLDEEGYDVGGGTIVVTLRNVRKKARS